MPMRVGRIADRHIVGFALVWSRRGGSSTGQVEGDSTWRLAWLTLAQNRSRSSADEAPRVPACAGPMLLHDG